ncbi:MAG: hypothetical protein RR662_05550 [Clostridia bacterium]
MKIQTYALENCYPIGSIYMTLNSENPNKTFGFGTWERIKGKMLFGVDEADSDFNTVEKTGGNKEHRHDFRIGMKEYFGSMGDTTFMNAGAYKDSESKFAGKTTEAGTDRVTINNSNTNAGREEDAVTQVSERGYCTWEFFTTLYYLLYVEKNSIGGE